MSLAPLRWGGASWPQGLCNLACGSLSPGPLWRPLGVEKLDQEIGDQY